MSGASISFHPERYAPSSKDAPYPKHSKVLFSGGKHRCPGMHLAKTEAALITSMTLQSLDLELETEKIGVDRSEGGSKPTPTWFRYQKRNAP